MSALVVPPLFLSRRQVEARHAQALATHGGAAGLRSESALESALAAPINDYIHADADLCGIAAAYAFHLAQAQAYLDGNERTGAACALVFLEVNGVDTASLTLPLAEAFVAVAERRMSKVSFARRLRGLFGATVGAGKSVNKS